MVPQGLDPRELRVRYPDRNAPRFFVMGVSCIVREVSEQEVVFVCPQPHLLRQPQAVAGVVMFGDGQSVRVDGMAQPCQQNDAVQLRLARHLPRTLLEHELARSTSAQERRRYFRLRYNPGEGPTLLVDNLPYEVVEISEQGLVFRLGLGGEIFAMGQRLIARIRFASGATHPVAGVIMRIQMSERIVNLSIRGITPQIIFEEQRRIIGHRHQL